MPEGPEIRRAADELEAQLGGKIIDQTLFGLERLKPWGWIFWGGWFRSKLIGLARSLQLV